MATQVHPVSIEFLLQNANSTDVATHAAAFKGLGVNTSVDLLQLGDDDISIVTAKGIPLLLFRKLQQLAPMSKMCPSCQFTVINVSQQTCPACAGQAFPQQHTVPAQAPGQQNQFQQPPPQQMPPTFQQQQPVQQQVVPQQPAAAMPVTFQQQTTVAQQHPGSVVPGMCTQCGVQPPNPGRHWCQSCFLKSKSQPASVVSTAYPVVSTATATINMCIKCNTNVANPGKQWCQTCFLASKGVTHQPTYVAASVPASVTPSMSVAPGMCSHCGVAAANPGKKWCQQCWIKNNNKKIAHGTPGGHPPQQMCTSCFARYPNPGKKWCGTCFQASKTGTTICVRCSGPLAAPSTILCPNCSNTVQQIKAQQPVVGGSAGQSKVVIPTQTPPPVKQKPTPPPSLCLACKANYTQKHSQTLCSSCFTNIPSGSVSFAEILPSDSRWANITNQFDHSKPTSSSKVLRAFAIFNPDFYKNYKAYQAKMFKTRGFDNERRLFHGTKLECNLHRTGQYCGSKTCATCNITRTGFDMKYAHAGLFGKGLYFAYEALKSHNYNSGSEKEKGIRVMLMCKVICGLCDKHNKHDSSAVPKAGCDSILGEVSGRPSELIVHDAHASLPTYVIVYQF
eukprot:TRINITY_DN69524_c0_g1_i1.p1 TRINITY_DN69524_c0_g1~~TRINITY_DN69524_c0_g1_i1.p1  ORF type:complete len:620 (-),score=61.77 TRINITY_DN69524_c0_g1_i1:59-1918(-)